MAIIGTFKKQGDKLVGTMLSHNLKTKFVPVANKESEKTPDYIVYAGTTEIGAAWHKTSTKGGSDYYTVKLDDPTWPAPFFANLFEADEGFNLVWDRAKPKKAED